LNETILVTELNDFIFCPISIYFHKLYGNMDRMLFQVKDQINGTSAHEIVDKGKYSTKKNVLMGMDIYCEKYDLVGKIDCFDIDKGILRERKKKVKIIYDGYVFQVYAQFFALTEMGYDVKKIEIHSIDDNKTYPVLLPADNPDMVNKMENTINKMKSFDFNDYHQENVEKCRHCIYEPACDRTLLDKGDDLSRC